MPKVLRPRLIALVALVTWGAPALALDFTFTDLWSTRVSTYECQALLDTPSRRALADEAEVVIAAWNPEGVEELRGKFERGGVTANGTYELKAGEVPPRELESWKFAAKQRKIMEAATRSGLAGGVLPHFVVAPEVESIEAAERLFNEGALEGRYRTFLSRGNDTRGIDIAFAVRADLDVAVELETHRHVRWHDPVEDASARVFTRDLPALIIRDQATDEVLFLLIGQHAKSMRDRAGGRDKKSAQLRAAQFAAARRIVDGYRARFGADVPIVMAGDFNADVRTAAELAPLRGVLTDAFDVMNVAARTTHTYHPADGVVVESQLDALMISDSLKAFVARALVLPEFDRETGAPLGPPKSIDDRVDNYPSDHRAISLVVRGEVFRRRLLRALAGDDVVEVRELASKVGGAVGGTDLGRVGAGAPRR